jgi:hypothetical protein
MIFGECLALAFSTSLLIWSVWIPLSLATHFKRIHGRLPGTMCAELFPMIESQAE